MTYKDLPAQKFDGFWYRCDVRQYASYDEWADFTHTYPGLDWRKFAVIKQTPKGVWIQETSMSDTDPERWLNKPPKDHFIGPWFVLGKSKKQMALPTKLLAWQDCVQRKLHHIDGCKARLTSAEKQLQLLHMKMPRKETYE